MADHANSDPAQRRRLLSSTLLGLDYRAVSDLFSQHDTGSPLVLWNPSIHDFKSPIVRTFAETMMGDGPHATRLTCDDFAAHDLTPVAPWLMLLEPNTGGIDFKYLRYGSDISAIFGQDMTGRYTSEIGGHMSDFFIALYMAVLERNECVFSLHEPPLGVFASVWRRLIFPLTDAAGEVRQIAAVNVPDNELRAGLEAMPDPALVAQPDGKLMYANVSARRLFGELPAPRRCVSEYCKIDLQLPDNVEVVAKTDRVETTHAIGSQNQIVVHFEIRISATYFRDAPYFVIQMKPE